MYQVVYRKSAQKAILKLPRDLAQRFQETFLKLAEDPQRQDLEVEKLKGRRDCRLRIGTWRALYRVKEDCQVILVLDIGPRGDIYK
jgi:mRNA interferase RelE/StbE